MRYAANRIRRDVRAGRRSTIGNRVCAKSVSGVRIPISPPEFITPLARAAFFYARGGLDRIMESGPHGVSRETLVRFCRTCYYALLRMADAMPPCGGVAEWLNAAVSKTVYPVFPGTRVRIPPPPPSSNERSEPGRLAFLCLARGFEPVRARRRPRFDVTRPQDRARPNSKPFSPSHLNVGTAPTLRWGAAQGRGKRLKVA